MEDGILYNLPHIKRYVLDDGIIKQGMFGCHFTHIRRLNKMRCDEVMPYLGDVSQMFGLEVHRMPFTINLPLTLPVGQYPNDFRVVGLRMEPIKGLRGNWVISAQKVLFGTLFIVGFEHFLCTDQPN